VVKSGCKIDKSTTGLSLNASLSILDASVPIDIACEPLATIRSCGGTTSYSSCNIFLAEKRGVDLNAFAQLRSDLQRMLVGLWRGTRAYSPTTELVVEYQERKRFEARLSSLSSHEVRFCVL
jgi:hypothetical protein